MEVFSRPKGHGAREGVARVDLGRRPRKRIRKTAGELAGSRSPQLRAEPGPRGERKRAAFPLPACGERVRVRGGRLFFGRVAGLLRALPRLLHGLADLLLGLFHGFLALLDFLFLEGGGGGRGAGGFEAAAGESRGGEKGDDRFHRYSPSR